MELTVDKLLGYALVRFVKGLPMVGYTTYAVNIGFALLWVLMAALTGHWEVALGFVGQFMSNVFMRRSNDMQNDKLLYLEAMLQDISKQVAPFTAPVREPDGPEADTAIHTREGGG